MRFGCAVSTKCRDKRAKNACIRLIPVLKYFCLSLNYCIQGVNVLANIKSALKRVKVTEKQNLRNRMVKSALKTSIRRYDEALQSGDRDAAEKAYVNAVSTVDKAAAKGVIHKNAASHKKAQLAVKRAQAI